MIWIEIALFLVVLAIGGFSYYLGYTKGAALGFLDGWILASRPPAPCPREGHVKVVYDWAREGL